MKNVFWKLSATFLRPQCVKSLTDQITPDTISVSYNEFRDCFTSGLWAHETTLLISGLCCQKQVSQAGISNYIPQFTVGCNYLSLPEITVSGNKVLIYSNVMSGSKFLTDHDTSAVPWRDLLNWDLINSIFFQSKSKLLLYASSCFMNFQNSQYMYEMSTRQYM